jgi:hypothetical protein
MSTDASEGIQTGITSVAARGLVFLVEHLWGSCEFDGERPYPAHCVVFTAKAALSGHPGER